LPDELFIVHELPSVDQAVTFANDPRFGAAMERAGITSTPPIEIFERV
jgi:hypothetical protein